MFTIKSQQKKQTIQTTSNKFDNKKQIKQHKQTIIITNEI